MVQPSRTAPPSAAPSRQGRAYRREEIERLLHDALIELMADGTPFRDLSVQRLIGAAGMARSTFYGNFADKEAMLQALSAGSLTRLYSPQRAWLGGGEGVTRSDIREGMRLLFDTFLEDEAIMRAVGEASVYDAAIRDAYLSSVGDYARSIERFIRRGQKAGRIAPMPAADTAAALAWMTERTVSQAVPGASRRRLDALADALTAVVCATLGVA